MIQFDWGLDGLHYYTATLSVRLCSQLTILATSLSSRLSYKRSFHVL